MLLENLNYIWMGLGAILVLLLCFILFQFILLRSKVNRLTKKYNQFMKGKDGASLEFILSSEINELRDMVTSSESMLHQQELLATMQMKSLQKIGLVRFDAFEETGDKLSFAMTVLDGKNNGFVLTSISGDETARIYAKQVMNGSCNESISVEEAQSIEMALNTLMPDIANELVRQNAAQQVQMESMQEEPMVSYEEMPTTSTTERVPEKHKIDIK